MMMDYLSQTTSSGGSDTLSGTSPSVGCGTASTGTRGTRVRTVRLVRPSSGALGTLPSPGLTCKHGPGLGFSLRGGREHGTGFFVSAVEQGSEAHRQGLRVGDQIIRVNGFTVEDAIHKEVLQLISNHTHLTLKVRSVGMIPVKDKSTDPLSWQIIPDYGPIISDSPPLEEKHHDVRIHISVQQRAKLGCGICKGPEWKPGIFVQFTKEGGIARDAGLRPGDQILYCNNIDFMDISFNEAVNIMKTSRQLDLIVRKGAGSELFPGESSGYNSSASSVTGDQSPSWSDSKRLSIVKEESLELEDRLSHLEYQRFKPKSWERIACDWDDNPRHYKPTIINLSENGTTIKNNGTVEECQNVTDDNNSIGDKDNIDTKLADICLVSHQHETKTVVVEVHRSDMEDEKSDELMKKISAFSSSSSPSPIMEGFGSLSSRSSTASSSLSNAISLELQRRSEKNKENQKKISIDETVQKNKILKGVDTEKKHQHDKLMDEFRRAHRKMFSSSVDEKLDNKEQSTLETNEHSSKIDFKDLILKDRQNSHQRLADRRSTIAVPEEASEMLLAPLVASSSGTSFPAHRNSTPVIGLPPPPPPMPSAITPTATPTATTINSRPKTTTKPKAPPVPQKTYHQPPCPPPPCPPPDYDTLSLSSGMSTLPRQKSNGNTSPSPSTFSRNGVDMDSLESFKLTNPNKPNPKPPSTYFNKPRLIGQSSLGSSQPSSQNSTLKKTRPVSVTIGEYPSDINKRQPVKFDFLNNGMSSDDADGPQKEPITSRLASELAQTLSRSNLRKRTESSENLLNGSTSIKPQTNGSVTISVNNVKSSPFLTNNNQHKLLTKSQSSDVCSTMTNTTNNIANALSNRVTIKISESDATAKTDVPSSILKNGNGNHCSSQHKPLVHQKSITFGEITTVINDRPMHVS